MKKVLFSTVIVGLVTMVMAVMVLATDSGPEQPPSPEKVKMEVAGPDKEAAPPKAQPKQEEAKKEAAADGLKPVPLSNEDCTKCHFAIVKELDTNGAAHKDVNCLGCHEEHPPEGKNVIPSCSDCHDPSEGEHFKIKGCTPCHNPHEPLQVDFTKIDEAKSACLTCHQDKGEEMKKHPSAHSEQDCNNCHTGHGLGQGQYQNCLDCHEGHLSEMKVADCLKCHKPHSPADVAYGDDIPVQFCASCHDELALTLVKSGSKHADMTCVECHDSTHGNIPSCEDCHDQPHDKYIHDKFPKCLDCHRDPHNLAK